MNSWSALLGVELSVVSVKEKCISAVGGLISIALLIWLTHDVMAIPNAFCIVASMGASAVLLFAVPHGQLSQPWPVLAGHTLSALVGVLVYKCFGQNWISGGIAVGVAIALMHHLKCVHPPGGATALTAVMGGDAIHYLGFEFVIWPVLLNASVMLCIGVLFNWPFAWRRYPSVFARNKSMDKPHPMGKQSDHEDVLKALKSLDSFVDVNEADMLTLSKLIAREREARILKAQRKRERELRRNAKVMMTRDVMRRN